MDADQGRKMVEGNYVKLSEAWDSNVSKARAPTAREETVGKKNFFHLVKYFYETLYLTL